MVDRTCMYVDLRYLMWVIRTCRDWYTYGTGSIFVLELSIEHFIYVYIRYLKLDLHFGSLKGIVMVLALATFAPEFIISGNSSENTVLVNLTCVCY